MGVKVGIDLGTTFCAVAWINPKTGKPEIIKSDDFGTANITPSVIQFREDGSILCGASAKEAFEDAESGVTTCFKREMGTDTECCIAPDGKAYNATQLSAILLKHLKRNAEKALGQSIDEAVITVPAYFEDGPRDATMKAAMEAGLKVGRIISEPSAAALNYGLEHWRQNAKILVYDLGGGTFDVTLTGMGKDNMLHTLGTVGEHKRGGRDWDERLKNLAADKFVEETGQDLREDVGFMNDLLADSEQWKKQLSKMPSINIKRYVNGCGNVVVTITREEFENATKDLLAMTGELCRSLLADLKVDWQDVTDVLLVGGSTRMPQVPAFLEMFTGKKPISHVDPDLAVAMGAAMAANMTERQYNGEEAEIISLDDNRSKRLMANMKGKVHEAEAVELSQLNLRDAVAHAMGIILVNNEKTAYVNETIIPKFSPVPCKYAVASRFHTGEPEMLIYVVQGDGPLNTVRLKGKYIVTGMNKVPGGMTTMYVQYSYDTNQKIHVQARQDGCEQDLPIREEPFTEEELNKFLQPYESDNETQPLTAVVAIDVSGSMRGNPLELAKKHAIKNFIDKLEDLNVRIGVIEVSDSVKWATKPTNDLNRARKAVRQIECGSTGGGNAADPFREIDEELSRVDGAALAVVLADGVWNDQRKAVKRAKECHRHNIEVAGIGFGCADQAFLDAISSRKDLAQFTDLANLGAAFGNIAQQFSGAKGRGNSTGAQSSAPTWDLDYAN